jgi:hypothetical protein
LINERNIQGYIGGSDAIRVHGTWETDTFRRFWRERLTGIKETANFQTIDTAAGNIMEAEILEAVGVPKGYWNAYFPPKDTIAGINTDAYGEDIYHEAKCINHEEASRWVIGYTIPHVYICQLKHGLFVTGAKEGRLHVCMLTPSEKKNPFSVDAKERTVTFKFPREYFDFPEETERAKARGKESPVTMWHYGHMLKYLTHCYNKGIFPMDSMRKEILNQFL